MDFQTNYHEKVSIWTSNSGCWYDLHSNKINIMTQQGIATLLYRYNKPSNIKTTNKWNTNEHP